MSLLAIATSIQSVVAADGTNCTASECNYSVPLDKPGFYTVAVTLPAGQKEGLYNLLIDPSVPYAQAPFVNYANGFHGGGLLRENGQTPSWLGFSLAQFEPVNVTVYNHSSFTPLDLTLTNNSRPGQALLKFGPILATHAQTYTVPALEPGFYVASVRSYPGLQKQAYSISIGANSLFGGISGGWLDANNVGWGGFYTTQPRSINFKVPFSNSFGEMGAGSPNTQIYYQKPDGTQELKWSSLGVPTETPRLITTRITDPQTDLSFIIANSNEKELMAIYGEKDNRGNLKSITDLTYSVKDAPSQDEPSASVNLKLGDGVTKPKVVAEFPNKDGKKKEIKVENYDPDKKTADLTAVETDEIGNETVVAKAEQQPMELPQESCYENLFAVDFFTGSSDAIEDCAHKWSRGMITKMMGALCKGIEAESKIPGIGWVTGRVFNITNWVVGLQTGGATLCRPFPDVPPEQESFNCVTKPIDAIAATGTAVGALESCGKKDFFKFGFTELSKCFNKLNKLAGYAKKLSTECKEETPKGLKKPNGGKAASNGDPHLYTFDRLAYDFQGVGEFILTKSMLPNDLFEVQVRQQPWGKRTDVAITQATAMNVAGDKIGFYIGQTPFAKINGIPKEISEGSTPLPKGGSVIREGSLYNVVWPNDNGLVEVKNNGWGLLVNAYISNAQKGQLIGLLGNADGELKNDISMRNSGEVLGTVLETKLQLDFTTLYPKYADSWRITQQESLFDYAEGETTETFTDRNFPRVLSKAESLDEITRANAEKICRAAGITDPVVLEDCILDVALTGEKGFAQVQKDLSNLQSANISAPPLPTLGMPNFGKFHGIVYDAVTKQVVNNVQVKLTVDGKPIPGITVKSTVNGFYETDLVPVGSAYHLTIESEGYISEQVFSLTTTDGQTKEVEAINLVPITFQGKGNITGTVRNSLDNSIIPNLAVSARRYINNRTDNKVKETVTDQNGVFTLENLEAGNYTLEFIGMLGEANYVTYRMTAFSIGGQATNADALIALDADTAFRIVLNWDSNVGYDLDAHLTGPISKGGRFHIYHGKLGSDDIQMEPPYARLYRDDKDKKSPEIEVITIGRLQSGGVYRFSVHDYDRKDSIFSDSLSKSAAMVAVYSYSGLVTSFNVPNQEGTLWTVFEIDETGNIRPVNTMGYEVNQGGIRSQNGIRSRGANAVLQAPVATDYFPIIFQDKK